MSGPIVRKYGFPNFEKIFGERPLEHGVEDDKAQEEKSKTQAGEAAGEEEAPRRKTATKRASKPKR